MADRGLGHSSRWPFDAVRVRSVLRSGGVDPEQVIGAFPPRSLLARARDVAVDAVLAGCPEPGFLAVPTALRATLAEELNLLGMLAPTPLAGSPWPERPGSPLGARSEPDRHSPGNRMNASIGRSGWPWRTWAAPSPVDESTQGSPAKYAYCFAENLEASPWGSCHVDRGFQASATTVAVAAGEGPHNVHDPASRAAEALLRYLCTSTAHGGHNGISRRRTTSCWCSAASTRRSRPRRTATGDECASTSSRRRVCPGSASAGIATSPSPSAGRKASLVQRHGDLAPDAEAGSDPGRRRPGQHCSWTPILGLSFARRRSR